MLNKSLFKNPGLAPERLEGVPAQDQGVPMECPACKHPEYEEELRRLLFVCPRCGHYMKIGARQRAAFTLDPGSFEETGADVVSADPLGFPGYAGKLEQSRAQSGENEAVVTGLGRMMGRPCAFFAMEPGFMMGSMGAATGEKLTRVFELALAKRLPVVGCAVSGGARVQEGILSLMQMAKVSGAVRAHSDAGLFYAVLLCDATTGGVTASFAMQADVILAEPGALVGFAGPRVIEQTTRQKLPAGFQRAEFLLQKGFVGRIVPRGEQRPLLSLLVKMHSEGTDGRV
ncbi:MAG TPA: acetyl-CoA carboxylase carboxyltransferase subunit beta [Candidatus Limnocylindria bacterium]|nr:acetyl-CoA carboxylase carboxyltransferase subunit beta [Candidatus Limnocylindria bacterium]